MLIAIGVVAGEWSMQVSQQPYKNFRDFNNIFHYRRVTEDGQSTTNNPYSWNSNANIMWVDQPAGVGYSYGKKVDHNETEGTSLTIYALIANLFIPFYVSCGGYVPFRASIHRRPP